MRKIASISMIAFSAIAFFIGFRLNDLLFSHLEFSHGVNWIFLPSGLRLLLVLVLIEYGAVGICIGSFLISRVYYFQDNYFEILITALISGFSPLIAREFSIHFLKMDTDLHQLSARDLLKISVLFALTSATLHQLWFVLNERTENFLDSTAVMSLGDWFGTALILSFASYALSFYKRIFVKKLY
jgi:hypothetical protein